MAEHKGGMRETLQFWWDWLIGDGKGASIVFLLLGAIGVGLLYVSTLVAGGTATVLHNVGQLIVTTGIVQLAVRASVWVEARDALFAKLEPETLARRNELAGAIGGVQAGLMRFTTYDRFEGFASHLTSAREVTVIGLSLGDLTSGPNVGPLRAFLMRGDTRLTAVLIDPDDTQLMDRLDQDFGRPQGHRAARTREAVRQLRELAGEANAGDRVRLVYSRRWPPYTAYRFDSAWVVTPYMFEAGKRPERLPIAVFGPGPVANALAYDEHWLLGSGNTSCREVPE